ncbi:hypothetical protein V8E36_002702 [Tilletia maclaganii]
MPAATRSRRAPTRGSASEVGFEPELTNATRKDDATSLAESETIYETFADIFFRSLSSQARPGGNDGEYGAANIDEDGGAASSSLVLDPEHGTALEFAEACRTRLYAANSRGQDDGQLMDEDDEDGILYDEDDTAQWALEYYTWLLLHALSVERAQTQARLLRGEGPPAPSSNVYHPALLRASDVLSQSPALRELNIVREWLHTILDPYEALPLVLPQNASGQNGQRITTVGGRLSSRRGDDGVSNIVEVRKGYWTFTKNALRAAKRGGHIPPSNSTVAGSSGAGVGLSSSGLTSSSSSLFSGIRKSGVGIGGGAGAGILTPKVLKTLDPDAPCRGEGELSNEDMAYERAFLRSLFQLTRAGKLSDALDLCRQADRPWRAASLRGAIPYFDPKQVHHQHGSSQQSQLEALPQSPYGNRNRALWKATARKLAGMKSLDPYERALYGALSGSLEPVLVCSSTTWEEAVWAYVNAKLEAGIESGLRKSLFAQRSAGNSIRVKREMFDEANLLASTGDEYEDREFAAGNEANRARSAAAARLGLGAGNDLTLRSSEDETALETLSLEDVFEQVEARVDRASNIASGSDGFRSTQRAAIVGDLRPLLVLFADRMESYQMELPPKMYARYIRFFVHVVLYLRSLASEWRKMTEFEGGPGHALADGDILGPLLLPEPSCDYILQQYIHVLRMEGQSDRLVALYSSALLQRTAGVEQYAAYLLSMGLDTPAETRKRALFRAAEFGLSLGAVARRTVDLIFADLLPGYLPSFQSAREELGSLGRAGESDGSALSGTGAGVATHEAHLLHALEWLTYAEDTYGNAVVRCNQLIRCFLASGRLAAARQALSRLTSEILVQLGSLQVQFDTAPSASDDFGDANVDGADAEERLRRQEEQVSASKLQHVEQLECLSWSNLFDALDGLSGYLQTASQRSKTLSTATSRAEFSRNLRRDIADAELNIKAVLEGDWLHFDTDEDEPEAYDIRLFEYKRIRQLFVPELVFSLHFMLFDSRDVLPDSLARALVLPNLVADGAYNLWQDFISGSSDDVAEDDDLDATTQQRHQGKNNRLPEYLEAVRQAELVALDSLGPDPFRAAILVGEADEEEHFD